MVSRKTENKSAEEVTRDAKDPYDYEVVNGRKIRVRPTELGTEMDENGYFRRQGNHYTRPFLDVDGTIPGDPDHEGSLGRITGADLYGRKTTALREDGTREMPLAAEPYRYRLVWAKLCHWSNRCSIVRELEGLQDAISVNMVEHAAHEKDLGWEYVYNRDSRRQDPLTGDQFLSESYYRADYDYAGRTTVPALIDLKAEGGPAVVSNDYNWLTIYLETAFRPFHKKGAPELYPKELRADIDRMNLWLFDNINNAVYRCWFCRSKEGYEQAYRTFYAAMDVLERRLAKRRFLFGDYVTDADIRLYVTLARLDIRYTFQLGETKHRLVDYPNLWGYARDLYQVPAFQNNTFFADFANPEVNDAGAYRASYNYRFLRQIDFAGLWGQETDRAGLSADPAHKFLEEEDGGSARTADGFAGFSQTPEEAAAWKRDAEEYEKIHSIPSTRIAWVEEPAVRKAEDLPAFVDGRSENAEAIRSGIAKTADAPDLSLTFGKSSGERTALEAEVSRVRRYIKESVTDTITTLLTATKLRDFQDAYEALYAAFDQLEERLSERRFLLGDFVSEADVELFVSLLRFDAQYSRQLGAVKHRLVDYKNLWGYARDLYQIPAFWQSVDWESIVARVRPEDEKDNYSQNTFYDLVLPAADLDALWKTETERAALSDDPTHEFLLTKNRRFDR